MHGKSKGKSRGQSRLRPSSGVRSEARPTDGETGFFRAMEANRPLAVPASLPFAQQEKGKQKSEEKRKKVKKSSRRLISGPWYTQH
ncbi:hypothetical protein GT3570_15730 [Geobacillus thermoleovorans]|uniref:Uncharacterized protein n=3 Tax=Geobacillus TaxID=129337 RepID=A0A7U9J9F8_GEOTM|nr:hypothetical protein GT3570_15730 [Geobacillus thermoleovorans]AOL35840.1 hypothetical protein BGM21_15830 [Geobacillus thermoleovorans]ESU71424.1 hypothetical protein T260_13940 [Geobacillus sp. MAS1]